MLAKKKAEVFCVRRKNQSKMNELCETNPIFQKVGIKITSMKTMSYNEKSKLDTTFGNVTSLPSDEQAKLTFRAFFPEDSVAGDIRLQPALNSRACYISVGMVVHADEKVAKGAFELEDLVADSRDAKHPRRFVEGKHLARWCRRIKWLEWGTSTRARLFSPDFPRTLRSSRRRFSFIVLPASDCAAATTRSRRFATTPQLSACRGTRWHGVRNNSLKKAARYRGEKPPRPDLPKREELEATSRRFAVKYLLGVMNSTRRPRFPPRQPPQQHPPLPRRLEKAPHPRRAAAQQHPSSLSWTKSSPPNGPTRRPILLLWKPS